MWIEVTPEIVEAVEKHREYVRCMETGEEPPYDAQDAGIILADAVSELIRDDDAEPLTPEWLNTKLRGLCGADDGQWEIESHETGVGDCVWMTVEHTTPITVYSDGPRRADVFTLRVESCSDYGESTIRWPVSIKSRGQLRALCRGLGIKLGDEA